MFTVITWSWVSWDCFNIEFLSLLFNFQRTSLKGFPAQSVRSSNAYALDSSYLLVLNTGTSQKADNTLDLIESSQVTSARLFDDELEGFPFATVNTKEYHSDVLEKSQG
ncbi:hypothetical protein Tco_0864113 [Tanacetum coccineum]